MMMYNVSIITCLFLVMSLVGSSEVGHRNGEASARQVLACVDETMEQMNLAEKSVKLSKLAKQRLFKKNFTDICGRGSGKISTNKVTFFCHKQFHRGSGDVCDAFFVRFSHDFKKYRNLRPYTNKVYSGCYANTMRGFIYISCAFSNYHEFES